MKSLACTVIDCQSKAWAKGLCNTHYTRLQTTGIIGTAERKRPQKLLPNSICTITTCNNPMKSKGYCVAHYAKLIKYGDPLWVAPRKEKLSSKESYERYKKTISIAVKKRREADPQKFQNYYNTYRARKKSNSYLFISKDLKKLSLLCCAYCGSNEKLEIEHIIPISRGGNHSIGNTTKACRSCNSSKGDRLLMEWRLGIKSPRYRNH